MGTMVATAFGAKTFRPRVRYDKRAAVETLFSEKYLDWLRGYIKAGGYIKWSFSFPEHGRDVARDLLRAVGIELPASARAKASKRRKSVSSELELPMDVLHLVPTKYLDQQEITTVKNRGDKTFKIYPNSHNFGLLRYFPQLFTLDTTQGVFGE